jgi:hypothetical protein
VNSSPSWRRFETFKIRDGQSVFVRKKLNLRRNATIEVQLFSEGPAQSVDDAAVLRLGHDGRWKQSLKNFGCFTLELEEHSTAPRKCRPVLKPMVAAFS